VCTKVIKNNKDYFDQVSKTNDSPGHSTGLIGEKGGGCKMIGLGDRNVAQCSAM